MSILEQSLKDDKDSSDNPVEFCEDMVKALVKSVKSSKVYLAHLWGPLPWNLGAMRYLLKLTYSLGTQERPDRNCGG